tara:strand:- start:304 stop:1533 length:1230 start_codon:yes stop_codon:yes gene_type:complete
MGWRFKNNEINYLKKVLSSDFSSGADKSFAEKFEIKFAKYHNQKYAIASNSGTSTLHQGLIALGVGHGDEVIIPALTVAMCGFAVYQCGAVPVYCDVNPKTYLLDPNDLKKKITNKTKAIMAVHIYGLMCDMSEILKIAKRTKIKIIEDCAQCFLGKDDKKRIAGTVGDVGSWSLESSKHISCSEGGIVTTNNKDIAKKIRKFGGLGFANITAKSGKVRISKDKFQNPEWKRHDDFGYNYRLSEINASVALAQTEQLKYFVKKRMKSGNAYHNLIKKSKTNLLVSQEVPKNYIHSYFTFAALFEGEKYGIKWKNFRKKFIQFGGDGIYAAWQIVSEEPCFANARVKGLYSGNMKLSDSYGWGETPIAKEIQKKIMQFTTNQRNELEIKKQVIALKKTIIYFEKKIKNKK